MASHDAARPDIRDRAFDFQFGKSMGKSKRGGVRPGAGRPRGAINGMSRKTREQAAASGELPHEFLLRVSRGELIGDHQPSFGERIAAADKAAPYFAPKMAAIEHTGKDGGPIETKDVSDLELARRVALVLAKAGKG